MNNFINTISPIVQIKSDIENINLYIKREDLLPFSFGGNKLRIALEFYNDMFENKCNCIICYGSSRSNLCRIIANMAKSLNIECHIIVSDDDKKITTNSKLVEIFGAFIHKCDKINIADTVENVIEICKRKGLNPYYIYGDKYGRGNESIPVNAYVKVYNEIVEQSKNMGVNFDYIFCASGTGMTQAGLIMGNNMSKNKSKIVGISVARKAEIEIPLIQKYIQMYCDKNNKKFFQPEIIFEDKYLSGGYALYTPDIMKIIKEEMLYNGLPLDTTYTGKAFAGMKHYLEENKISHKNVLFIHTGGTPLFFDNMECINQKIVYRQNSVSPEAIFDLLQASDNEFSPALSSRVNLKDYAKKIYDNGNLFEAYSNDKLVALVAMYANDYVNKKAYITYVYCDKQYRKNGITNQLLQNAMDFLRNNGFEEVSLEVSLDNEPAINLYKKFNFEMISALRESSKALLRALLGGGGSS